MSRRILTPQPALAESILVEQLAPKVVPSTLLRTTLETVAAFAAVRGGAEAGASTAVILLAKGVMQDMFWNQLKTVGILFVAAGAFSLLTAVGLGQRAAPRAEMKKEQAPPAPKPSTQTTSEFPYAVRFEQGATRFLKGDQITITVLDVRSDRTVVGIKAPPNVCISRAERPRHEAPHPTPDKPR